MNMLDRRALLKGVAAIALAPVAPVIVASPVTAVTPAESANVAWIVGTPGEYDAEHIIAKTAEKAFALWSEEHPFDYDDDGKPIIAEFDEEFVQRMPEWDGLRYSEIAPGDWIRAGVGHCCNRCGYETSPDMGAMAIGCEAVCEDCLGFDDRWVADREDTLTDLTDRVIADGEEKARSWLERQDGVAALKAEAWALAATAAATLHAGDFKS